MLKRKVVTEEKKPEILKTEEVVETVPVVDTTPVAQLAAVVEPTPVEVKPEIPVIPAVPEVPLIPEVKKKFNLLWPIWIALAFVLGAGAGFGLSKINFEKKTKTVPVVVNKTTVSPIVKPTDTVEKKLDRGMIKIKVLNGSGVKGAAATIQSALDKLGYKNVVVGNVEGDNYKNSEVSMKDSLKVFEPEILKDLKAVMADKKVLASDDAFDVLFIIGEK